MKSGTVASLSGRRNFLSDRKVARSAGSSGKMPGFAAAITQFSAGAGFIGRAGVWRAARRGGQDAWSGRGQDPMLIRATSQTVRVRGRRTASSGREHGLVTGVSHVAKEAFER